MTCATCTRTLLSAETAGGRVACFPCGMRLRAWLAELPRHLPILEASVYPERTGPRTGTRAGRSGAGTPVRTRVLSFLGPASPAGSPTAHHEDQDDAPTLRGTLGDWAAAVDAERRPARPAPPPGADIEALCGWLDRHIDWLCCTPQVTAFTTELRALVRTCRSITSVVPRRRSLPAPCPCGAFGLVEIDWSAYIECGACGRLLTGEEYDRHQAEVMPPLHRTALLLLANWNTREENAP
ncbi:hypothetical protein GCM10027160_29190 [Streptomyces calidiresistens]|uniref:Uncharacterized protein n=1 Tax=Streptomyces calidiresistens TaxID=1485586 RepID=A0A7W3XW48_9ACTN|nr:hypothetical protein [Streptomyces calidiresistens]MBB0229494.1 hypothetical protein [Streptomyces calidiresistens]